ncbi:MAG: FecR family protein [bacterium]|nr:FecR family protein [bacterium]
MLSKLKITTLISVIFALILAGLVIGSQLGDDASKARQDTSSGRQGMPDVKIKHRGEVTHVDGNAKRQPSQSEEWVNAIQGSEVTSGDKVRTLRDSRAELALTNLNVLRLAPMTTIDIKKLYEETKEGKDETQIDVEQGDIWAMVGEVKETSTLNIGTPVAGTAITGTRLRISVEDDSSTMLKVYEGEVKITNAPDNKNLLPKDLPKLHKQIPGPKQIKGPRQVTMEEWYYIVKKMQSIQISKDGEVVSSGDFSTKDQDEQSDWVKWNLERDSVEGKK